MVDGSGPPVTGGGRDAHRGFDWPVGGGDPFSRRRPWPSRFYWAHQQPSRLFTVETTPPEQDLLINIPMGYTTLRLLERVALLTQGSGRGDRVPRAGESTTGVPDAALVVLLRPSTAVPAYQMLEIRSWTADGMARLARRIGDKVLVCRVLEFRNWH